MSYESNMNNEEFIRLFYILLKKNLLELNDLEQKERFEKSSKILESISLFTMGIQDEEILGLFEYFSKEIVKNNINNIKNEELINIIDNILK